MLTNVQINNFKSLVNLDLGIKPITILIGPNGGGKSSVLQALAVLKQTITGGNYSSFVPNGEIINLGIFQDISHQHEDEGTICMHIGGKFAVPSEARSLCQTSTGNLAFSLTCNKQGVENLYLDIDAGSITIHCYLEEARRWTVKVRKDHEEIEAGAPSLNGIIPIFGINPPLHTVLNNITNGAVLRKFINDFYLVPASRGIDLYGVPLEQYTTDKFATSEGPIKQAIRLITKLHRDRNLSDVVSGWTKRLVGKEIRPRVVENVNRYRGQDDKNIYGSIEFVKENIKAVAVNEGYGINQLVLLLTELALRRSGDTIGVEEPEVHLHPKAQSDLAKILIEQVKKKGIQVIFTTHSEHMLYPFLVDIARKSEHSLRRDAVAIYYFEYNESNKATEYTPLVIDENGMIEGGLKGFFEEKIATLNEYIKALSNE